MIHSSIASVPDVGYLTTVSNRISRDVQQHTSFLERNIVNTSPLVQFDLETSLYGTYQPQQTGNTSTFPRKLPGGLLRTPSQVAQSQLRGSNPRCFLPFRSLTVSRIPDTLSRRDGDYVQKHCLPLQPNFLLGSPERTQLIRQKTIDDMAESQRKQRISRILSLGIQRKSTPSTGSSKVVKSTSRHGLGPVKHARNHQHKSMHGGVQMMNKHSASSFRQVREAWS